MSDKAFKALWREQLSLDFHPSMRREATLISLVKRLDTVTNFLRTLSDDREHERDRGFFVAQLAVDHAFTILEQFNLLDGPSGFNPTSLAECQTVVSNLRAFIEQQYAIDISTAAEPMDDQDEGLYFGGDESDTAEEFTVDPNTFSVRYRGNECVLRNSKPFHVLARLNQSRGRYVDIRNLIDDVWGGDGA